MGLLDFLNGSPGGMDATGMGPPTAAQPGFFDKLGGMLGGGQGQIDPALAAQLGLDPEQLRHQQAKMTLMHFLAAAASAPGRLGHNASIGDSLAAGMNGALSAPNTAQDQIRQALLGAQTKRANAQATREDQANAQSDALAKGLQGTTLDPKFVSDMGIPEDTLKLFPPDKLAGMVMNWNSGNAAEARAAAHEAAANTRQDAQIAASEAAANRRLQIQLGAQNQLPPIMRAMTPEQQRAYLNTAAGLDAGGQPAPSKADIAATDKRLGVLQDTVTRNSNLSDRIGAMIAGLQDGTFNTGGDTLTDRAGRGFNQANQDRPYLRSDNINQFDKNANDLVTQYLASAATGGQRGSVALLKQIQASKPGVGQSTATNLKILTDMKNDLDARLGRAGAEMNHYNQGGTIRSWGAQGIPDTGAGGAGQAAPSNGQRPAGLPASAKLGSDGQWYDPATGRIYKET